MKIIYLHQYFNTPETSGSTRSYEFSKRLVKAGHKVIVISTLRNEKNNHNWIYKNIDGIDVYFLPNKYNNNFSYYRRVYSFLRFSFLSIFKIMRIDFDIIFATSTPLTIAIPALLCSKLKRKQFIFEVRDLWPELPIAVGAIKNKFLITILKNFEKIIYRHAKKIICLSPGMKRGVVKTGTPTQKIITIPNSCDFDLFDHPKFETDNFKKYSELFKFRTILYAGTLGKINGVGYLLDLANLLSNEKGLKFIIVGDGIEKKQLILKAKKLNIFEKNLFILDEFKKADIVHFYRNCTISCSLFIDIKEMWANSANKFFDTMSAKKPILINYGGWHSNLIRRFNTGKVLPPNNLEIASKKIKQIIYDDKKLVEMGKNNFDIGMKFFQRDDLFKKFENTLLN